MDEAKQFFNKIMLKSYLVDLKLLSGMKKKLFGHNKFWHD